jgi:uncharacterized membrane protein
MSILSLLGALIVASVASPSAATTCGLALGVVLMYGVILRLARERRTSAFLANTVAIVAVGGVAALTMAELLRRWSAAVGLSPVAGIVAWSAIIAMGLACDSLASWWQGTHESAVRACFSKAAS